jgi:hypothetical protein
VQDAALLAEERNWDGDNPEDNRVQPDQGIENEIGAQTAKPAIFSSRGERPLALHGEFDRTV